MAAIDKKTLLHLCDLSRLSFTDEEQEVMVEQMSDIIQLMDTIREVDVIYDDTKDHNEISYDRLREDEPEESYPVEKLMSNTQPGGNGDCYTLPKMME